jgi:hypothetical protein
LAKQRKFTSFLTNISGRAKNRLLSASGAIIIHRTQCLLLIIIIVAIVSSLTCFKVLRFFRAMSGPCTFNRLNSFLRAVESSRAIITVLLISASSDVSVSAGRAAGRDQSS